MLVLVEEEKRKRPTPTPSPPPIPAFLPPPRPPRGREGGGGLFTFLSYYIQLTQPHMLRVPHFLESFGVRAGGIEKMHSNLKGHTIRNKSS
jgi:hypothetical protein